MSIRPDIFISFLYSGRQQKYMEILESQAKKKLSEEKSVTHTFSNHME
jgi:hypothetical protein